MYKFLYWTKFVILYDNTVLPSRYSYNLLELEVSTRGWEIIGNPELRAIDVNVDKNEFMDSIIPLLDEIIESRARIFNWIFGDEPEINWILEYLYDEGLRIGDIICILVGFPYE